jgi:hypothetical protein
VELCEPLFFKGRQGTGRPGGRCGYADASLNPAGGDWRKYEYTYRVWGRLLYNPKADPEQWRRYLRSTFGPAASHAETALAHASRVLPLLTTAHQPSASNLEYWVEVPPNMPMADGGRVPYNDTPSPKRFGTVSPLDPEMFSSVDEHAAELLAGNASGKYSPVEVAQFFEDSCTKSARAVEAAADAVPSRTDPAFRRWEEDILIQVALGRFYAAKLRAGVWFDIYRRTGDPSAHERAVAAYRDARATWEAMAERAGRVYVADLTYGEPPARRGHWLDRLPGIDRDLAAVESAKFDPKPEMQGRLKEAMARALGRPARPTFSCAHTPPRAFQPGQAVSVTLKVSGAASPAVTLRYRHVNQAERWQFAAMRNEGQTYRAAIPAAYTQSPFALQYYFHLAQDGSAGLYPGFNEVFANQPYFVVTRA